MSQEQAPAPYFVTRVELYVDSHGRRITRLAPASGTPPADFVEFIGEGELPCTHEGQTFKVPARFPIEGVRTKANRIEEALGKAFARFDEAAESHREECQAQFEAHVAKQKAEMARQADKGPGTGPESVQGAPRSILEKPLHDPNLPEHPVDSDGKKIIRAGSTTGKSRVIVP